MTVTDVLPDITVTKTADPTHVPETGGDVTFTFVVENHGVEGSHAHQPDRLSLRRPEWQGDLHNQRCDPGGRQLLL